MNKKLFIGGLSWNTNNDSLKTAFSKFGETTECKVVVDKITGKSKGFGFVSFENQDQATAALEGMNNQMLDGRTIKVDYATEKPAGDRPPRTGGFGGDRGGRGGGGGGFGGNRR
ncbi:MAG: RNA recognition motif domain-containing protein [Bacteriovoracaceae bacterium]